MEILDTIEMQRLRGIKQLGSAYLVYPTAVHTRFDHSIGVNSVFKKIYTEIKTKNTQRNKASCSPTPVAIACLIHDITHIPFGHTIEDDSGFWGRHDERERYEEIFHQGSGEIGEILRRKKLEDEVLDILTLEPPKLPLPWTAQILTAPICADLLDYLRRDAYFCGLNRSFDDRILKYFDIQENDGGKPILLLDLTKNNVLRVDALSEIYNILRLRCFLTQAVYYHHTKICADAIISKALHIAIKEHNVTRSDLERTGDEGFFQLLLSKNDPRITKLVSRIQGRKLLKRAFEINVNTFSNLKESINFKNKTLMKYLNDPAAKNDKEHEIAGEAGISEEDVIIYCVGDDSLKESSVCVKLQYPENITELNRSTCTNSQAKEIEQEYLNLWKFFVFTPKSEVTKVSNICETVFGHEGGHHLGGPQTELSLFTGFR